MLYEYVLNFKTTRSNASIAFVHFRSNPFSLHCGIEMLEMTIIYNRSYNVSLLSEVGLFLKNNVIIHKAGIEFLTALLDLMSAIENVFFIFLCNSSCSFVHKCTTHSVFALILIIIFLLILVYSCIKNKLIPDYVKLSLLVSNSYATDMVHGLINSY